MNVWEKDVQLPVSLIFGLITTNWAVFHALHSVVDSLPCVCMCSLEQCLGVCIRRVLAASYRVAGLAPVSLKLCNSFARPQITASVQSEQLPTYLEARKPLRVQGTLWKHWGNFHEFLITQLHYFNYIRGIHKVEWDRKVMINSKQAKATWLN
jgi:hypothetical protein